MWGAPVFVHSGISLGMGFPVAPAYNWRGCWLWLADEQSYCLHYLSMWLVLYRVAAWL
jgi:hypothetical protein